MLDGGFLLRQVMANGDTSGDAKTRLVTYALSQGPAFVLLAAILAFLGYAVIALVPNHLKQIQEGYKDVSTDNKEAITKIVESHEKDREMYLRTMEGASK